MCVAIVRVHWAGVCVCVLCHKSAIWYCLQSGSERADCFHYAQVARTHTHSVQSREGPERGIALPCPPAHLGHWPRELVNQARCPPPYSYRCNLVSSLTLSPPWHRAVSQEIDKQIRENTTKISLLSSGNEREREPNDKVQTISKEKTWQIDKEN